ncbi:MAG: riboflavin synthase subunit beta [Methylibium sp. NZG]|nr:MAG: riboflavin synthase subunit beta [Methylibium sp. NZG]
MNQLQTATQATVQAAASSAARPASRSAAKGKGEAGPDPAWRFAFIHAQWHADIVHRARDAFLAELARHRIPPQAVEVFEVPGAFELPLHACTLAATGRFDAIVACGFVVDGGIYRHEFVADAVVNGLMRVQLDSEVPVISCVLTPKNFHEHEEHRRFFAEHFVVKGGEAARACLQTVQALHALTA